MNNAAYWDPGLGAWLDMNRGFNDLMYCVQAFGNSVYAGGQPNRYSDTTMWGFTGPGATALVSTLHRWVIGGSAWQDVGNLQSGAGNDVLVLRASSTLLYIGGIFQYTGGTSVTGGAYLATYSGTAFSSFGTSLTAEFNNINAIALQGSEVYVGTGNLFGSFSFSPGYVWRFGAARVPCSGGQFISFTLGTCELCPAGSFGTGEWPCPAGSTCLTGTTCTGCPAGSGSTATGQVRVLQRDGVSHPLTLDTHTSPHPPPPIAEHERDVLSVQSRVLWPLRAVWHLLQCPRWVLCGGIGRLDRRPVRRGQLHVKRRSSGVQRLPGRHTIQQQWPRLHLLRHLRSWELHSD